MKRALGFRAVPSRFGRRGLRQGGAAVVIPPAPTFWTTQANGPVWWNPDASADVGSGVTRLRYHFRVCVPSTVPTGFGTRNVIIQEAAGFDVTMSRVSAGSAGIVLNRVEDGSGVQMLGLNGPTLGMGSALPENVMHDINIYADMLEAKVVSVVNGQTFEVPFTAAVTNPQFQNSRGIAVGGSANTTPTGILFPGMQFEFIRVYKTVGGVESPHLLLEGGAPGVNGHPWRLTAYDPAV